jgi:hypothetical protein
MKRFVGEGYGVAQALIKAPVDSKSAPTVSGSMRRTESLTMFFSLICGTMLLVHQDVAGCVGGAPRHPASGVPSGPSRLSLAVHGLDFFQIPATTKRFRSPLRRRIA